MLFQILYTKQANSDV